MKALASRELFTNPDSRIGARRRVISAYDQREVGNNSTVQQMSKIGIFHIVTLRRIYNAGPRPRHAAENERNEMIYIQR